MTLARGHSLRRLAACLREHCPPMLPFRVRRCRMPEETGAVADCRLIEDDDGRPAYFAIRIDSRLPEISACDALAHEVAHCLSWTTEHPAFLAHGPEFGLAYARAYKAYEALG